MTRRKIPTPKKVMDSIAKRGGQRRVAEWTGCAKQTVNYWYHNLDAFPAEHCAAIEKGSEGLWPKSKLRPDLFE